MRPNHLRLRRTLGLLVLIAAALGLLSTDGPASLNAAGDGLSFPAPAGSNWTIAGGYNTATHTGGDPYAIDVVRTDAPTAGTPVLAPLEGRMSHVSSDCISIRDDNSNSILICHLFHRADLERGDTVRAGEIIGQVAPEGFANNNGLAHLHLAVHTSFSGGSQTLPFTGQYTLDNVALPATTTSNAYVGTTFRSSNALQNNDPNFLYAGWNQITWPTSGPIADTIAPIANSVAAVYTFDGATQSFARFSPIGLSALNDVTTLNAGDAVLLFVASPAGVVWSRTPALSPQTANLAAGFNLVTWTADQRPVADAVASLGDTFRAIYAFDAASQRYQTYRAGAPAFLNDLTQLNTGQAVWIELLAPAPWVQN